MLALSCQMGRSCQYSVLVPPQLQFSSEAWTKWSNNPPVSQAMQKDNTVSPEKGTPVCHHSVGCNSCFGYENLGIKARPKSKAKSSGFLHTCWQRWLEDMICTPQTHPTQLPTEVRNSLGTYPGLCTISLSTRTASSLLMFSKLMSFTCKQHQGVSPRDATRG